MPKQECNKSDLRIEYFQDEYSDLKIIIKYFQKWRPENGKSDLININGIIDDGIWAQKCNVIKSARFDYFKFCYSYDSNKKSGPSFSDKLKEAENLRDQVNAKGASPISLHTTERVLLQTYDKMLTLGFSPSTSLSLVLRQLDALYIYYSLLHSFEKISLTALFRMDYACQLLLYRTGKTITAIDRHGKRDLDRIFKANQKLDEKTKTNIQTIREIYDEIKIRPGFKNRKPWTIAGSIHKEGKGRLLNAKGEPLSQKQISRLMENITFGQR